MESDVVMAGLVPAIHALAAAGKTWMRGTSPRMTGRQTRPGVKLNEIHHSAGDSAAFRPLQLWGRNSCGVSYFGLLRPAGISPEDRVPETVEEQSHLCFLNIGAVLEHAGLSFKDIVRINAFVVSREH